MFPKDYTSQQPKLLADSAMRAARRAQLTEPHVAPLAAFVAKLRSDARPNLVIPDFDPWDGGVMAELLYLLEAPGARARDSGFVSRENPDETAKAFLELNCEALIPRERTAIWNIVPWYIGTDVRIRAAARTDIDAGITSLTRLLELLPRLRAVVLLGRKAERATSVVLRTRPGVKVFPSPHPSPLFINRAQGNRQRILSIMHEVATYLERPDHAA